MLPYKQTAWGESVVEFMRADFGKKFPPKVVEGNIAAVMRAYEEVKGE